MKIYPHLIWLRCGNRFNNLNKFMDTTFDFISDAAEKIKGIEEDYDLHGAMYVSGGSVRLTLSYTVDKAEIIEYRMKYDGELRKVRNAGDYFNPDRFLRIFTDMIREKRDVMEWEKSEAQRIDTEGKYYEYQKRSTNHAGTMSGD